MKTSTHCLVAASLVLGVAHLSPGALAQGTTFIYQGRLLVQGAPAEGAYDLTFALFDSDQAGHGLGPTNSHLAVPVRQGTFVVPLDFGNQAFDGTPRWLEIGVRSNGTASAATPLVPRQPILATPLAWHARQADLLAGFPPAAFAPAASSPNYVAKVGDTMSGRLNLPVDGLAAGGQQLTLSRGLVGIGTRNPLDGLSLGYGVSASFDAATSDQTSRLLWRYQGTPLEWIERPHSRGGLAFGTDGAERVFIDGSGNVGLGTSAPATKLDVVGTVRAAAFQGNGSGLTGVTAAPAGSAGGDLVESYPNPKIAPGSVTSAKIADGTITDVDLSPSAAISGAKIAGGQVVKSVNGLRDTVSITAGANVSVSTVGNAVQIASAGATLSSLGIKSGSVTVAVSSGNGFGTTTVTFATPYPNANYSILLTPQTYQSGGTTARVDATFAAKTATGFTVHVWAGVTASLTCHWTTVPVSN